MQASHGIRLQSISSGILRRHIYSDYGMMGEGLSSAVFESSRSVTVVSRRFNHERLHANPCRADAIIDHDHVIDSWKLDNRDPTSGWLKKVKLLIRAVPFGRLLGEQAIHSDHPDRAVWPQQMVELISSRDLSDDHLVHLSAQVAVLRPRKSLYMIPSNRKYLKSHAIRATLPGAEGGASFGNAAVLRQVLAMILTYI